MINNDEVIGNVLEGFEEDHVGFGSEKEGGVIEKPLWPDGCRLTLNELAAPGSGHVDCRIKEHEEK